jgi:hypothetical protein
VTVPLYALDAIDEAVEPTRSLVSRLGVGDWLKLGAVTLFVGGFGSASFSANVPRRLVGALPDAVPGTADLVSMTFTLGGVVTVGVALAVFLLFRSFLEFVLYEALREDGVAVRRSLRRWWHHGLQLWAFRVTITWSMLAGGAALATGVAAGDLAVGSLGSDALLTVAIATTFGGYAVVAGLTTRFVVPVMVASGAGLAGAWLRFLRTVAANPGQYVTYLLVGLFVRFVADVLALSAALLLVVLLAVPLVVVVVPTTIALAVEPAMALSPPLVLLSSGLSAGYVIAALLGVVLARLPFVVYVRHYALGVLRGTAPSLDPMA